MKIKPWTERPRGIASGGTIQAMNAEILELRAALAAHDAKLNHERLKNTLRGSGYVTWNQADELAELILVELGKTP